MGQEQAKQYRQQVTRNKEQRAKQQAEILRLRTQISEMQRHLADVEKEELETSMDLCGHESRLQSLQQLQAQCATMAVPETHHQQELHSLLSQKPLASLESDELSLVWWRMSMDDKQQAQLSELELNGQTVQAMSEAEWLSIGISSYQAAHF